jgi:hypothetical protein
VTPTDVHRTEHDPHDRLTRIAAAMTATLEQHPEYDPGGDVAIVFLSGGEPRQGGTAMFGYDDDLDAMLDLLEHMRAVFDGKSLMVLPIGEG